ncbi:MAG: cell division protein FtsH, partial [Actinobacteria bacterium]|nr:cell division protein FtsH [Actinomycetota bacterium]
MKSRKIFRGPTIWILLAIFVVMFGFGSINTSGFKQVDTSLGLQMIKDGRAKSVLVIENEQRVDVTLKSADVLLG